MSINIVPCNFNTAGISAKLLIEPTEPNPGPTLPIHATVDENPVIKSRPNIVLTTVPANMRNRYMTMNTTTECSCDSSCNIPSTLILITALGCCCNFNRAAKTFAKRSRRSTLIPPDVEPAHAHIIDAKISSTMANGVQRLVSAVAKPVVEITEMN